MKFLKDLLLKILSLYIKKPPYKLQKTSSIFAGWMFSYVNCMQSTDSVRMRRHLTAVLAQEVFLVEIFIK